MRTAKKIGQKFKKKQSIKHTKAGSRPKRLAVNRALFVYGVLIVLSAVIATAAAAQNRNQTLPSPFSSAQRSMATFRLYYPARLPSGYSIEATSLEHVQQAIVAFRIINGTGTSLNVTEQPAAPGFNLDTFYSTFGNRTTVKTDLTPATVGTIDEGKTRLASLVTQDGTWILLTAPSAIPANDLAAIIKHWVPEPTAKAQ